MNSRYSRQILFPEIGEDGQQKLQDSRILVIGTGGLGCPVSTYLISAGIGYLRIVDYDTVSLSNLNRQFLYTKADLNQHKVTLAQKKLTRLNPNCSIDSHLNQVTTDTIDVLLKDIDLVVDCVDNLETRLIVNDACLQKKIPLIEAGIHGFYGFIMLIESTGPCLRCAGFDTLKTHDLLTDPAPVLGSITGTIGTLQATETIKNLLNIPSDIVGHYVQYDAKSIEFYKQRIYKNPLCNHH